MIIGLHLSKEEALEHLVTFWTESLSANRILNKLKIK